MTANRKMTGWILSLALLLAVVFPNGAFAATGDLVSIEIEGSGTTVDLTVGKSTKQLKVWGTFEGSTVKRDLTNTVKWTSSDDTIITVSQGGSLTPLKEGTVTIRADYDAATSSIQVRANDSYKELKLEYQNEGKFKLDASEDKLAVKAIAAVEGSTTGATKDVTADAVWTSSDTSVLTIDKGQIKLVSAGTATVTAKYSGLTATFKATVSSPYSELSLNYTVTDSNGNAQTLPAKDIELVVGDPEVALQAVSTAADDKTVTQDVTDKVTWTTSDSSVATVTEDGKLKAVGLGKVTVTAQYLGVRAETDVYVRTPYEVILFNPSDEPNLFIGEKLNVAAEMRSGAGKKDDVTASATWTSSNPLVAKVSGGEISAMTAGITTIKVTHLGISKTMKVTVYPSLTSLKVEKTELEMFKGESLKVPNVIGTKLDDEELDFSDEVEWTSSNDDIAKVEDGKIKAVAKGSVTLTAKLPDTTVTAGTSSVRGTTITVKLTVNEKVLTLITEEEKLSVIIGKETALPKVNVVWEDGEEADMSDKIEWSLTGSNAVIKTTSSGKVIKGLSKGSATLKGTYSNKTISIPVTIEQEIVKIVVEPGSVELNIKKSKSIKVTGYYKDGKTISLSSKVGWESSNTNVATVSSTSVKAIAEGTATLTGSYQGKSVSVKVSVVPKLTKLTVDEKTLKLAPGYVKTVVLTAEYDNGTKPAVTGSATWTSSKPSVAKVTAGKIEAVGKGSATIKAVYGGKTVTVRVTVK